jgi:hypothetical protein
MHCRISCLLAFLAKYSCAKDVASPHRISFESLSSTYPDFELLRALRETGVVAVTGIPKSSFPKDDVLSWDMHECSVKSASTQHHTFDDGSLRRTFATHTVPGPGGMQQLTFEDDLTSCSKFAGSVNSFRNTFEEVTDMFAAKLSAILNTNSPIMSSRDGAFSFDTFQDVVVNGEHLEHFHSYQRLEHKDSTDAATSGVEEKTIDMHTDQGMFIAFTPGRSVHENGSSPSLTDGFFVEMQDGSRTQMEFKESDDIVFMLGDGVNQYINPKIVEGEALRAVPHFLKMSHHSSSDARVWYGLMVLPPAGAFHQDADMTFGDLRDHMINASRTQDSGNEALTMGCSSSRIARQLEETSCAEGESIYCWHRCMPIADYGVSLDICAEESASTGRALRLQCVNPRGQLYLEGHGDYYPDCTDSTENSTDYPTLPNYPRDDVNCTAEMWADFASDEGYDGVFKIQDSVAHLMWNVVNATDGSLSIDGKLVFNGIFGYLSIGFPKEGGRKNGMSGASIIMGLPGGNYSAVTGLDLSMETKVEEYVIDPDKSAFRHWSDAIEPAEGSEYAIISTGCFTALTFKTSQINGIDFNINGEDALLWGANPVDYYAGYHGGNRNVFKVNWKNGTGYMDSGDDDTGDDDKAATPVAQASASSTAAIVSYGSALSALLVACSFAVV